jgi:hypothetical protein
MSGLRELQETFQHYLLDTNHQAEHLIISTKKVNAQQRLAIYSDAYQARLLEALEDNFPVLKDYMGEDEFYALGCEYIHCYPSTFRSIRWFGDQLAIFLREHSQYLGSPWLSDFASVEWALSQVFDAADSDVFTIEDMNAISPDAWVNMTIHFHPSVHRILLSWNIFEIRQALLQDKTPKDPIQNPSPMSWLLWRKDFDTQYCSLIEDEAWAMEAISQGAPFSEMCEGLSQWMNEEDTVIRAVSLLKSWITAGIIQRINI